LKEGAKFETFEGVTLCTAGSYFSLAVIKKCMNIINFQINFVKDYYKFKQI